MVWRNCSLNELWPKHCECDQLFHCVYETFWFNFVTSRITDRRLLLVGKLLQHLQSFLHNKKMDLSLCDVAQNAQIIRSRDNLARLLVTFITTCANFNAKAVSSYRRWQQPGTVNKINQPNDIKVSRWYFAGHRWN